MAIMRELAVSLHCRGARRAPHHWCASGGDIGTDVLCGQNRPGAGGSVPSEIHRLERTRQRSADALFGLGLWVPAAQPVASGLV